MSGPTPFLPFLSFAEAKCLEQTATGRIGGLATAQDLFDLLLADKSEFAGIVHGEPGNWGYQEERWEVDGQSQFEGLLRKVTFYSPIRNAAGEPAGQTLVAEEQRFHSSSHSNAVLEVRRFLRDLPDADNFVVVIRLVFTLDGFTAHIRVFCGVHFFKRTTRSREIREGAVRAYKLSFERWCAVADRYARKHDDGVWGIGKRRKSGKDGKDRGRNVNAAEEKTRSASVVPVLSALRSSVGSSNSLQLDKCHPFLGQYIYLSSHFIKVIHGEEPGELVLEEREWALSDKANAFEDLEETRSAASLGSSLDHAGYVDFPAGLPPAHWSRMNDRIVRWLLREAQSNGGGSGGGGGATAGTNSLASPITLRPDKEPDSVERKWMDQVRAMEKIGTAAAEEPPASAAAATSEMAKAAVARRNVSGGNSSIAEGTDAESISEMSARSDLRGEADGEAAEGRGAHGTASLSASDAETGDGAAVAAEGQPPVPMPAEVGVGVSKASSVPYTVVFKGRRMGLQLRELHGISVVGGLQGYDPEGGDVAEEGVDEADDDGGGGGSGAGGDGCVGSDGDSEDYEMEVLAMREHSSEPSQGLFEDFQSVMGGSGVDEMQTVYGGATETSSILASDLADPDVTVKCIIECPQVFGPGVKKLWRWRPGAAALAVTGGVMDLSENATAVLPLFHRGLAVRLGFGCDDTGGAAAGMALTTVAESPSVAAQPTVLRKSGGESLDGVPVLGSAMRGSATPASVAVAARRSPPSALRVSYLDPEVGELLELDGEAWPEFLDLKSKRLFVTIIEAAADAASDARDGGASLRVAAEDESVAAADLEPGALAVEEPSALVEEGKIGAEVAECKESEDDKGEVAGAAADAAAADEASAAAADATDDAADASQGEDMHVETDAAGGTVWTAGARPVNAASAGAGEPSWKDDSEHHSLTGQMGALRARLERVSPSQRQPSPSPPPASTANDAPALGERRPVLAEEADAKRGGGDQLRGDIGSSPGVASSEAGGNKLNGGDLKTDAAAGQSPSAHGGGDGGGEGGCGGGGGVSGGGVHEDGGGGILGAGGAPRRPCIGAVLVSVNGVRTQGLSFANVVELLKTLSRPITLEFVDSWDAIFHRHLMETEVREKISRATFEQKMRHPLAAKLRKQIDEYMQAFREQDIKALMSEAAERERERQRQSRRPANGGGGGGGGGEQGEGQQSPAGALWSLVRWLEQELPDVGIFSNSHRAGGGLPVMGDLQWKDVCQHLERFIFEQVFDQCLQAAPDYGAGDAEVTERLASLRFLKPRHWCVDFLDDGGGGGAAGREWELAQRELCRIIECRCPMDMVDCVKACVRLVALSVEASLQRRHSESAGNSAKKKKVISVGADDLLAALTWVAVQANPPRLASRLWYMCYYMRDAASGGGGEGAYCLTQLASALQFARSADASVLADVTQAQFDAGLARYAKTQAAIRAASFGDREGVEKLLFEDADPNGLSADQQHTVLTAAVAGRHVPVVKTVLQHPATELNVRVCPNYGRRRGRTALMLAAEGGDITVVLALLGRAGSEGRTAIDADGLNAVDYAKSAAVASVLLADPAKVTLCQAAKAGNLQYVEALLLQSQDSNATDATGQFTPLVSATLLGNLAVMETLLRHPNCDVNKRNARGETALMYSVQREGHATPDSQVAAAVMLLAHGADRYSRDREGRTALDWAERYGSTRLADIIRVDPRQVDVYAAAKERDVRAVMALLEQGVDPNARCPIRDFTALIASVFNKDEDMVRALLQHPHTDPNRPGRHGMTPLMYAAQAGHERMVCLLLQLKADRYRLNERGESALEIASVRRFDVVVNILKFDPQRLSVAACAARNDWPAIQGLVAQGVSVNARHRIKTSRGWLHECYTPLVAACAAGHAGLTRHLLEWEVLDVNLPNLLGQTALMYAAARGFEAIVLALLAADCDRGAQDAAGRTALRWAESSEHRTVTAILRVDPKQSTMPEAAAAGAVEDVWALMRQGVSPDEARVVDMDALFRTQVKAAGPMGLEDMTRRANVYRSSFEPAELPLTPLAAAAIFGRAAVVGLLLDDDPGPGGATAAALDEGLGMPAAVSSASRGGGGGSVAVDARDPLGRTALMHAARFGSEDIVLRLLAAGASRNKKDKERKTASELAIAAGHLGIAGIISADPERVDMMDVAAEGKLVLVDGLIKQGVPVDYCHPDGRHPYGTPLIAAAANARPDVVQLILQQPGIAVDRANARGETALMAACNAGALGVARQLLVAGADRERRDKKGLSAEHHAYNGKGHLNMVMAKALFSF